MDIPASSRPEEEPAAPADRRAPTSGEVFHDAAVRFLDVQITTDDTLDRQNATVISVGSAVLPVTVGLLGLSERVIPTEAAATLSIALACYFLLLLCSWRGSRFRGLEFRPHLPTLREHSDNYEGSELRWWVALEYVDSTEVNRVSLEQKARWIGAANTLLYLEAFLLSLAALLTLL